MPLLLAFYFSGNSSPRARRSTEQLAQLLVQLLMLLSLDRLANQIGMTEALIGNMLAISPGNVTKATHVLQDAGP